MDSTRTILLLTGAPGWRGSAASYLKIADGLARLGMRVRLLAGGEGFAAPFRAAGIPADVHAYPDSGLGAVQDLATRLRANQVGVVIADTPRDLRLGVAAGLLTGARVLYRYNLSYRAAQRDALTRWYLSRTRGLLFQSRAIEHEFDAAYPSLARHTRWIIPNGYGEAEFGADPAASQAMGRTMDLPPGAALIVVAAVLSATKGHDVALQAVARLGNAGREVVLALAGGGGHADVIRAEAEALGVTVRFPGRLPPDALRALYAAADVVLHPAEREIFPNAIAEAMALGKAVVAVDSWGTPEVMGDAGVLVPPREPDAMAAALAALLDDPARRAGLGERARARIRARFPLARMTDAYGRVVKAAIGEQRTENREQRKRD